MDFESNIAATCRHFNDAGLWMIQGLADGRLLARVTAAQATEPRLIRLHANGALDSVLFVGSFGAAAAQPDGRILLNAYISEQDVLLRLRADGSPDSTFPRVPGYWLGTLTQDGKFFSVLSNIVSRFEADGSRDPTFIPHFLTVGIISPQPDGKILMHDEDSIMRLHPDGSMEHSFYSAPLPARRRSWTAIQNAQGDVLTTQIDAVALGSWGFGEITQIGTDGIERVVARFRQPAAGVWCQTAPPAPVISLAAADRFFISGSIYNVDGYPRHGLARLFLKPPERDFRVLTPARFRRNDTANITIMRTGPTTNAATIAYRTRDHTARAGRDYESQTASLHFAPLEVTKTIRVPLLSTAGSVERLSFAIELENPSPGYTAIASTPVHLLPDLTIALHLTNADVTKTDGGYVQLELHPTMPGSTYHVEYSSNLTDWVRGNTALATDTTVALDVAFPANRRTFFRALEE